MTRSEVLRLRGVGFRREGRQILRDVDWTVLDSQRWVVLGANGSGKTTLARIAALWERPSEGSVEVLSEPLGRTDVRRLRRRVAFVSAAMADMVRNQLTAREVVVCAKYAALEPWWHEYTDDDHARADELLAGQGVGPLAGARFGSLSSGERQRVLLARALMGDPELVILDEPAAGLDLGGREQLIDRLDALAESSSAPPVVLVTHHVEEIPPSFTHLLALRAGSIVTSGRISDVLDDEVLNTTFGVRISLSEHGTSAGVRFSAART